MCGITGTFSLDGKHLTNAETIRRMADTLEHRGPDESSVELRGNAAFGFKRLSIIDLANGQQPYFSPDGSVMMICNGEIYNHREIREELGQLGYRFKTQCDVEVILQLYLEYGCNFLSKLNGQFAFAIYDRNKEQVVLGRDQFGICPLFYTVTENVLVFGSEIKAILEHSLVKRAVDLTGLDQVFSFPATVSPTTMFKGVKSIRPGHYLVVDTKGLTEYEYWDLEYPMQQEEGEPKPESYYIEKLDELLQRSINYRLNADVPVGFYLSGGLDSSLIGGVMKSLKPQAKFSSFSIGFPAEEDREIDERYYQRMLAKHIDSKHNEILFNWEGIEQRLRDAVYFSEAPLKESYNVCSLALSNGVQQNDIKVVLCGEGADELFGGYFGYKFDQQRQGQEIDKDLEHLLEDDVRAQLWGDPDLIYEKNQNEFRETKQALYSDKTNAQYAEFDCLEKPMVDHKKVVGRHVFNQRSYLDMKLRLAGHLIADHGDRMTYSSSVEGRYPFLDVNLVEFAKTIPHELKLNKLVEKYILKKIAGKYIPNEIIDRQKFGFVAPASPDLLANHSEWANDLLSYERIKRQGYFNPDSIERLKQMYSQPGFKINAPYESDLLMVVLTFNIFLDTFKMPDLN